MPQSTTTQPAGSANSGTPNANMSQHRMVREAGFTSFNRFLLSYGLKMSDPDDVEEGKAILKALFQDKK